MLTSVVNILLTIFCFYQKTFYMSQSIIIAVAIVLLVLATVRLVLQTKNRIEGEKVVYIRSLNYNFSANVDSIIMIGKNGRGFLVCKLAAGDVDTTVEDRLNQQLTYYKWMRFLFFTANGQPQIFLDKISNYRAGDSVCVNSNEDRLVVYRNRKLILESAVTHATWQQASYTFW